MGPTTQIRSAHSNSAHSNSAHSNSAHSNSAHSSSAHSSSAHSSSALSSSVHAGNIHSSNVHALPSSALGPSQASRQFTPSNDLETAYASRARQIRLDMAEERSLSGAMVGLCAGWMAAGGAGALVGLAVGALLPIWQDR